MGFQPVFDLIISFTEQQYNYSAIGHLALNSSNSITSLNSLTSSNNI